MNHSVHGAKSKKGTKYEILYCTLVSFPAHISPFAEHSALDSGRARRERWFGEECAGRGVEVHSGVGSKRRLSGPRGQLQVGEKGGGFNAASSCRGAVGLCMLGNRACGGRTQSVTA